MVFAGYHCRHVTWKSSTSYRGKTEHYREDEKGFSCRELNSVPLQSSFESVSPFKYGTVSVQLYVIVFAVSLGTVFVCSTNVSLAYVQCNVKSDEASETCITIDGHFQKLPGCLHQRVPDQLRAFLFYISCVHVMLQPYGGNKKVLKKNQNINKTSSI